MKAWRFHGGFLLAISVASLALAQPEADARAALDQLVAAGNYSWKATRGSFTDPLKRNVGPQLAAGETTIDGYTTAKIAGRKVVLHGSQSVVRLKDLWRPAADLSDDEVAEILRRTPKTLEQGVVEQAPQVVTAAQADGVRHRMFRANLPHEALRVLLQLAKNFRREGDAIMADAATTMDGWLDVERYLSSGVRRDSTRHSSPLSIFARRGEVAPPPARPLPAERRVTLVVTLEAGAIAEFAVEITGMSPVGPDGELTQPHPVTHIFSFKLTDIGTTTVDVDPEAKALFLGMATSP